MRISVLERTSSRSPCARDGDKPVRRQLPRKWPGLVILRLLQVEMAWQYLDLLRIYTKVQMMPLPCSPL